MGTTIYDDKQTLLDLLAKEPTMVISTAYVYAKNYVLYGEDITKAWTTAVQQTAVIQNVIQKTWEEAYDSFKKEYENRLKADMVAMLTEIQLEIDSLEDTSNKDSLKPLFYQGIGACENLIQGKINTLRGMEK